jgi:death-on-curing protein
MTVDEVIRIRDLEVPGTPLINRSNLESAVGTIAQGFDGVDMYPTIHTKAAALMRGVAAAHGFLDGNKRTALIATFTFYAINGWYLIFS